ncbi:MAG: DUF3048 domain-containing protein [Acidimicrobiia bacterium]|nr:DUF3048 domain-containing protein [Acidimicrobiia bacterium]
MRFRVVAMGAATVLVAVACGAAPDSARLSSAESAAVGSSAAATADTTPPLTSPYPSTGAGRARELPTTADDLAYLVEDASTTVTTATTSTTAVSGTSPSTTTGSGGAPVTTVGPGQPADPGGIYRGELGVLDLDEVVTAAVAPPPTVPAGVQPLTGLTGDVPNRPAAVVKIDNGARARPQSGIDVADIVVEEEVEGGVTRFAAIFHSTNAIVGPVRSGRTTDIGVLLSLGTPVLLYSGANDVTDALLLGRASVQNHSAARSSGYWRDRSRRAPSNLYTDTAPHWASATGSPPPPLFAYRGLGVPAPGEPTGSFAVAYRANRASWDWDGTAWLRSQGGRPHTAASGARIAAANVVVIETEKVDTGMVDSSGAEVPEFVFVGSGRVTVFTDGKKLVGTWTRPTLRSVATLTTDTGDVIELTPGRTWIELIEAGAGILQ